MNTIFRMTKLMVVLINHSIAIQPDDSISGNTLKSHSLLLMKLLFDDLNSSFQITVVIHSAGMNN
jgi:hypothetical protein